MKRVLIVEDDEDIRDSIVELLEDEGYLVRSTENGQHALDYLMSASELPQLILLDLMMPTKDGFQFCMEKIHNDKIAHIPVVIMSADGHVQDKLQRTKACHYIKKPLDIEKVIEAVERYGQ